MRYDVDPDELRQLADALQRIHHAVDGLGRLTPDAASALGSPLVSAGVQDVTRNWSHARRRIGAELDALVARVDASAASYAWVEDDLAAALVRR
jgi:hypothetical protein